MLRISTIFQIQAGTQLSFRPVMMSMKPQPRLYVLAWQSQRKLLVGVLQFKDAVIVGILRPACTFVQVNFYTHRIPKQPTYSGAHLEQYMCMEIGLPALLVPPDSHTLG